MIALIIVNTVAAAVVVIGLAVAMRLGHLTAGGRVERVLHGVELPHGTAQESEQTSMRRAA